MKKLFLFAVLVIFLSCIQRSSAQIGIKVGVLSTSSIWERYALEPAIGQEVLFLSKWEKPWRLRAGIALYSFGNRRTFLSALKTEMVNGIPTDYFGSAVYRKYNKSQFAIGMDYRLLANRRAQLYLGTDAFMERTSSELYYTFPGEDMSNMYRLFWNYGIKARVGIDYLIHPHVAVFGEFATSMKSDRNWCIDGGLGVRFQFN